MSWEWIVRSQYLRELERLREVPSDWSVPVAVLREGEGTQHPLPKGWTWEIGLSLRLLSATAHFELRLGFTPTSYYRIAYDRVVQCLMTDRHRVYTPEFSDLFAREAHRAPRPAVAERMDLRIVVDVSAIEIFVDSGRLSITDLCFASAPLHGLELRVLRGTLQVLETSVYSLRSIWRAGLS